MSFFSDMLIGNCSCLLSLISFPVTLEGKIGSHKHKGYETYDQGRDHEFLKSWHASWNFWGRASNSSCVFLLLVESKGHPFDAIVDKQAKRLNKWLSNIDMLIRCSLVPHCIEVAFSIHFESWDFLRESIFILVELDCKWRDVGRTRTRHWAKPYLCRRTTRSFAIERLICLSCKLF